MPGKRFRLRMTVQPTGHTFLPTSVKDAGFEGELDVLPNHYTVLLIRPGATTREVLQSLQAHTQHLNMVLEDEDQKEATIEP